jgi:hypothetical protein
MLLVTIAATSVTILRGTKVSFEVLDIILGHLDGVDYTVKNVGDDVVADLEHDADDSVDNAGENGGDD